MEKIRWGIIGCGDVTEVKSGPAFYKIEGSELVAVMRRDGDKARDYAQRHQVPRWYDQADALIADAEVDAVYIATPPDSHAEYTIQVARAGKPVYVEKPMARNHAECQAMIAACQQAQVPLFVAYYRRTLPAFCKVKALVDEGAIGPVRYVSIELCQPAGENPDDLPWRVVPEISGGGYFFDLASHQLDYLDHLLGPISAVAPPTKPGSTRPKMPSAPVSPSRRGRSASGSGISLPTSTGTASRSSATKAGSSSRPLLPLRSN